MFVCFAGISQFYAYYLKIPVLFTSGVGLPLAAILKLT
jgi:hypothetical protein